MSIGRLPRPAWRSRREPTPADVPPWVEAAAPTAATDLPLAPAAAAPEQTVPEATVPEATVPAAAIIAPEYSEPVQRYRAVEREHGQDVSVFPPCSIQTQVDAATAARLFERVARSWTRLGETEPYWSVLSELDYLMQHIGETRDAFLASGRENVERLQATLRRNGVAINPQWDVLELGCGLGRNTRFLAQQFQRIFAVDVSSSHLRLARKLNVDAPQIDRVEWMPLVHPAGLAALPAFDLFFSMIVLQHNPPPVIGLLLEAVADKLRPGGYAFFQVPTYQRGYAFDVESYLALRGDESSIEMHAFPQAEVFRIFRERGCVPLEVFEDGLSGHRDNHRSDAFLFHKVTADQPHAASSMSAPARIFHSKPEEP